MGAESEERQSAVASCASAGVSHASASSSCQCADAVPATDSEPHPPATVGLVNLGELAGAEDGADSASIAFLLRDFEEAYRAYAHEMAQMFGVADDVTTPRFVHVALDDDNGSEMLSGRGFAEAAHAACGSSDAGAAPPACDSVVVGYALGSEEDSAAVPADDIAHLFSSGVVSADARVYVVAVDPAYDAESALAPFDALRALCNEAGLRFSGGVLIGGGALLLRMENMPRMGAARRRVSEATDELIEAVREGRDAGIIKVKPPMPRFLYNRLL